MLRGRAGTQAFPVWDLCIFCHLHFFLLSAVVLYIESVCILFGGVSFQESCFLNFGNTIEETLKQRSLPTWEWDGNGCSIQASFCTSWVMLNVLLALSHRITVEA